MIDQRTTYFTQGKPPRKHLNQMGIAKWRKTKRPIKHSPVERFSADTYPMVPLSLGGQGLAIPVITGFPTIFTIEGSSPSPF